MEPHFYAIAIGSNRRHGRHGAPRGVIAAAIGAMEQAGLDILGISPVIRTPALGPAGRSFANAAALVATPLDPPALLVMLNGIERDFRRRRSRRWGARVLDLDIAIWSGGRWPRRGAAAPGALKVPHIALTQRDFVLRPLLALVPAWRPGNGYRTVRHAAVRLNRRPAVPNPVDRARIGQ